MRAKVGLQASWIRLLRNVARTAGPVMPLAIGATACASMGASPYGTNANASVTEVAITATEFKLDPAEIRVTGGQTVRLTFHNKGTIEHDWEVRDLRAANVRVVAPPPNLPARAADAIRDKAARGVLYAIAGPGQQMTVEFTPQGEGTYEIACEVPGHKEVGMVGKLVIGAGGRASAGQPGGAVTEVATGARAPVQAARLAQPVVASPLGSVRGPELVQVEIEARELVGQMDEGVAYEYWTFEGGIPGPMIRIRQGDTVQLTLKNAQDSRVTHSIDLHAVTGPGGGAKVTQVAPGQEASFRFQALNPGVYVYHCATPPVPQHVANGMYGLIVVEPPAGLRPVDREFYVMQGDFYAEGARGEKGQRQFSQDRMLDERPEFVTFNGSVGALTGESALRARVGETVRIFFGVGGPNLPSSFHVIGEIFDRVYPEGSAEPVTNVQTTLVPAGGAAIVEFTVDVPGDYVLVDHSLGRLAKGAAGILRVEGPDNPMVFLPLSSQLAGEPAGAAGH